MLSPEKQVPPSKSHVSDMGGVVEEAQRDAPGFTAWAL